MKQDQAINFPNVKTGSRCDIRDVGKRRDGGHRYWCVQHHANATAKYGVAADHCVATFDENIEPADTLDLIPGEFAGGIAVWGAVPAVYDTTAREMDRGIHVHARVDSKAEKVRDETVRRLRIPVTSAFFPDEWLEIDELDAINFMVSSVFNHKMKFVACTLCGFPHLDRDWFAVHAHKRHLCHGCGRQFSDTEVGIGNPAYQLHMLQGSSMSRRLVESNASIELDQADYPGGIQIWGSNPAIVWTGHQAEKKGIHVHAYQADGSKAIPDGTFLNVRIDGIDLNQDQIRVFMAQCAMPHIRDRLVYVACPTCGLEHFDIDELAYTPHIHHECHDCNAVFTSPTRFKLSIGNPFVETRKRLAIFANRALRPHLLELRQESI